MLPLPRSLLESNKPDVMAWNLHSGYRYDRVVHLKTTSDSNILIET